MQVLLNYLYHIIINFMLSFHFHRAYGYSSEDVQMVIESMAAQGKEPTFCMGDDIPLAVLSQKPHMLYDYFKQRFAQVGNVVFCSPGYFHEVSVMSLDMSVLLPTFIV